MLHILGIRHHGPGSARRVLHALEQYQPDCLIVECPADADKACAFIADKNLVPPAAILIYDPENLQHALYYPFASFSPEWQALRWAYKRSVEVRLMDLPAANQLATRETENTPQLQVFAKNAHEEKELAEIAADPLGYLATLAGYEDKERWWELTFEQYADDTALFEAVLELISALREEIGKYENPENLLREAHMRKVIRKAQKDGFKKIAVVCGAWHGPALQAVDSIPPRNDDLLLKGLPKVKIKATWVPWSYDRLAFESGYGAGVDSPAWYELLFEYPTDAVATWMARVSALLREEGMEASAAHAVEAVHLTHALTALRRLQLPGLEELESAALTVFCGGNSSPLELIRRRLIVGNKVGRLPPSVPSIPLQQDLLQAIKTARLTKYWEQTETQWLKASASNPQGGLDLREEADRQKSALLHRLQLLGIPWGELQETPQTALGSFKELWRMQWQPDFMIRIIEASMWGNTVLEAVENKVASLAAAPRRLAEQIQLVRDALRADLPAATPALIQQLQGLAALTHDVYFLMEGLPMLVNIIKFGDARQTDVSALRTLTDELFPRITLGLAEACTAIDENVARDFFRLITTANGAIGAMNQAEYTALWLGALQQLAISNDAHSLLQGVATRLLFDRSNWDLAKAGQQMYYALSKGQSAIAIAHWTEGFLHGSGLLLIHHPELWQLLDYWLDELPMETFTEVLPLLRRTFSNFTAPERQKMLQLAQHGVPDQEMEAVSEEYDAARTAVILPALHRLLGGGN